MNTRSKARNGGHHSAPSTSNARGSSVTKGILKNTIEEPGEQTQQPVWSGPMTRSRARTFGNIPDVAAMTNQQKRTRRPRSVNRNADTAGLSNEQSIFDDSESSGQICQPSFSSLAAAAIPSTAGPSSQGDTPTQATKHLSTFSLLPRPPRINVLDTLVKAFPITVPQKEVSSFLDSCDPSDLTADLKRYYLERRTQQRNELETDVSVFTTECPWEPKWFTNLLTKLILKTKPRPDISHYLFDVRQREQDSTMLEKWKALPGMVRWTVGVGALLSFMIALCFLIDTYGEEGVSFSVPLILFVNIILVELLMSQMVSI